MNAWTLFPLTLGAIAVLQGLLNRQMAGAVGLGQAAAINGVVVGTALVSVWLAVRTRPDTFPDLFHPRNGALPWWFVVPGLCGGAVVLFTPWAIARLGAAPVFIGVVAGQMLMSVAMDALVLGAPISATRLGGAALTVLGVWVASR